MPEVKRPPKGLGPRGRELWRSVLGAYSLTPTEAETLRVLCSTSDQLQRIDLTLQQSKVTTLGSCGQTVAHPLYAEFRAHAETVRRLARQLNLPDAVASSARKTKTNPGRVAHLRKEGA
jgi:hypothetical protein